MQRARGRNLLRSRHDRERRRACVVHLVTVEVARLRSSWVTNGATVAGTLTVTSRHGSSGVDRSASPAVLRFVAQYSARFVDGEHRFVVAQLAV